MSLGVFLFAVAKGVQRNTTPPKSSSTCPPFLFAVAKGVQRNMSPPSEHRVPAVSIRCREGRTAEHDSGREGFLDGSIVSIRCREGRTAERELRRDDGDLTDVSIRCREGRTAERHHDRERQTMSASFYSLSRRAYSGTCRLHPRHRAGDSFLFAVAKGVQRNCPRCCSRNEPRHEFLFAVAKGVQRNAFMRNLATFAASFYSLSRRAYSGTRK